MRNALTVTVWGGAGMTGGELLRLLARHPGFRVRRVISRSRASHPVTSVHSHLRGAYDELRFSGPEETEGDTPDLAFLALPHGASLPVVKDCLSRRVRVVDLSADLRLADPERYARWYGHPHEAPELLSERVYGLPELHREELRQARCVSGVGCNATCAILGLLPLARAGVVEEVHLDLRVGSSEGGAEPSPGSHHPIRSRSLRVVTPFFHRHLAEVAQELALSEECLSLSLTAVELVRGVQLLASVRLSTPLSEGEIWSLYRNTYRNEPFVRCTAAKPTHLRLPDPRYVLGSNQVLVGFERHPGGRRLLAGCALDNLIKGAAGSALQSANLMAGFDETLGLDMMPVFPA